jgi:hypothetical protein
MDNTPEVQPLTQPVLSAAISISQFKDGLTLSGTLGVDDGMHHVSMRVSWDDLPMLNCPDNASTWLYGALSQLIQNYDAHTIEYVIHEPSNLPEMHRRG